MLPNYRQLNRCLPHTPIPLDEETESDRKEVEALLQENAADRMKAAKGKKYPVSEYGTRQRKPDMMRSCWTSVKAAGMKIVGKKGGDGMERL